MKNLLAAIMISLTFFSCQKDDIQDLSQGPTCNCYSPLGVFAHWDYETTRTFYDNTGNLIPGKEKQWTSTVQNVENEVSNVFEDGAQYHIRKQESSENGLYQTKYIRQSDNQYLTPDKLFLQDTDKGTSWQLDLHRERKIADRLQAHRVGGRTFNDVIVVEEVKNYNNGGTFITAIEYYAKNVGLIYSTTHTYDNQLISTDTKSLVNYISELNY